MKVEEYLNVKFDETPPPSSPPLIDDELLEVDIIDVTPRQGGNARRKQEWISSQHMVS
ncbi:hypothetical protein Tco_0193642, partial [Tanacetum coccineum]